MICHLRGGPHYGFCYQNLDWRAWKEGLNFLLIWLRQKHETVTKHHLKQRRYPTASYLYTFRLQHIFFVELEVSIEAPT